MHFGVGVFGEFVVLGQQGQVVQGVHVVVQAVLQVAVVVVEGAAHGLAVDHDVEGEEEEEDEDGRDAVAPDVDALIVQHEQTPYYFRWGVEVDAVPVGYVVVVLHEFGCGGVVSDEVAFLVSLAGTLSLVLVGCVFLL